MKSPRLLHFPVFLFSCFLVFLITATSFIAQAHAQIVEIPDPNLERAIRETLKLPTDVPITQQEMLRLTGLAVEAAEVETLIGLEYATNLESLYLRDNPIKDLTPLAKLTQLELLHMPGVLIDDLTLIANLTQLKELILASCGIQDISPLAGLTQLTVLDLTGNGIVDVSPLANLTALKTLLLDGNDIVDVSPLANLTALRTLYLEGNQIVDLSPVQELPLTDFRYDEVSVSEVCLLPASPIQERIDNRSLPSVIQVFDDGILNRGGEWWAPQIPYEDRVAHHDLWWFYLPFGLDFQLAPEGYQLAGDLPSAIERREALLSKNPNLLFLIDLRYAYAPFRRYPEDWFGWLKDENGNLIPSRPGSLAYMIDFRLPEVQDAIVQRAIAVAKCGLYDGIAFDSWNEDLVMLTDKRGDAYLQYERTPEYRSDLKKEQEARISILRRIREGVRDDFLILCNFNWNRLPLSAPYINGGFLETFPSTIEHGYTRDNIIFLEDALLWYEANVREPKINSLRGLGIGTEPPDSPRNRQWMRLFTTMSLTLSNGYALYTLGYIGGQKQYQKHIWHSFWDADLGQPVGPTVQRYQEDIEGLYIREFTNGWAVYNRSGSNQTVLLPSHGSPVSDRGDVTISLTHQLPDLDGEIYLKVIVDRNGDGVVDILDLIVVSNHFGTPNGDVNGDGMTNIFDLTLIAQQLGQ